LLWSLSDNHQLVELTAEHATIEASSGARQTYRRKPAEPDRRVLAWELTARRHDLV
jgi:hypothetical protein